MRLMIYNDLNDCEQVLSEAPENLPEWQLQLYRKKMGELAARMRKRQVKILLPDNFFCDTKQSNSIRAQKRANSIEDRCIFPRVFRSIDCYGNLTVCEKGVIANILNDNPKEIKRKIYELCKKADKGQCDSEGCFSGRFFV